MNQHQNKIAMEVEALKIYIWSIRINILKIEPNIKLKRLMSHNFINSINLKCVNHWGLFKSWIGLESSYVMVELVKSSNLINIDTYVCYELCFFTSNSFSLGWEGRGRKWEKI